ncbi:MAG TPA: sigma-70 family RNA polymerase sigma factor [Ktedonobacterales bacterium]|nr:sigma-70 family RNA polymerase sigma factor [Ktedonobacterales bacterium]
MDERDWLAQQFEANRSHLRAVAYRMLGSLSEADDAIQEAWLHLSRADTSSVANLGGWLTTVVARVCLDQLRSRGSRREEPLDAQLAPEPITSRAGETNPEQEALMADAVGLALLVVLDTLNPAERLAFVLHDLFDVPFDEIALIVGRSPTAARQLASRARRRVRGQRAAMDSDVDLTSQHKVVDAFLAASRAGDFEALLALLDPEVALRADDAARALGAWSGIHGAQDMAKRFTGVRGALRARMSGAVGAVWAPGGQPRVAFVFTITHGKIVAIDLVADPERHRQLDPVILDG